MPGEEIILSVDAMGGDEAPRIVIEGAALALERKPRLRFLFHGDRARLAPVLAPYPELAARGEIRHTKDTVSGAARPSHVLRHGRQSSMARAIASVEAHEAQAVISAGNTGAFMALAMSTLGRLAGIRRPALAAFIPTLRRESLMLDLGANVVCGAEHLVQFARLGATFARSVLGLSRPSVGLLNVGSEETKGHEELHEAAAVLSNDEGMDFRHFIEGYDIGRGSVDVIVCDGFVGNITVKGLESYADLFKTTLDGIFRGGLLPRAARLLLAPTLRRVAGRFDTRARNGGLLLGLDGIVVKSHGGADGFGFAHSLYLAADMVGYGFQEHVKAAFVTPPRASSPGSSPAAVPAASVPP